MTPSIISLLHGPDQPGIVAKVSGWIHERGGNVLHADQHLDRQENVFFQRVEWDPASGHEAREDSQAFVAFAQKELGMSVRIALSDDRPKVALMVSKADHCFHDLVLRVRREWNAEFAGVLSNHEPRSGGGILRFALMHFPMSPESKPEVETGQHSFRRTRSNWSFSPATCKCSAEVFLNGWDVRL